MRRIVLVLVLFLCREATLSQESAFRLAPLFGSDMVLQQKSTVPIWGKGTPGTRIAVHASWK